MSFDFTSMIFYSIVMIIRLLALLSISVGKLIIFDMDFYEPPAILSHK